MREGKDKMEHPPRSPSPGRARALLPSDVSGENRPAARRRAGAGAPPAAPRAGR